MTPEALLTTQKNSLDLGFGIHSFLSFHGLEWLLFIFSYGMSCLPSKKNYLSPMTGKEKHGHWTKILQFDSMSDFYGCYKHMIYSQVAVREKVFVILTRL